VLNRDGDCLSDLVMPMFGSNGGAKFVLLAFDEDYTTTVAKAESPARHRTHARGQGRRDPGGDAAERPPPSCTAPPRPERTAASDRRTPSIESLHEATADGVRTPDLGGQTGRPTSRPPWCAA